MNNSLKIAEKRCDICKDRIGLFTPWYSVVVKKGRMRVPGDVRPNPMTFCRKCYHAYENFLIEREVQENHKKTMQELKGVKTR